MSVQACVQDRPTENTAASVATATSPSPTVKTILIHESSVYICCIQLSYAFVSDVCLSMSRKIGDKLQNTFCGRSKECFFFAFFCNMRSRHRRFWHATHDCVAPYVDIILHRGRFLAKSAASGSVRWCCFRSCWTVLSHMIRGRPSCLLQSAGVELF